MRKSIFTSILLALLAWHAFSAVAAPEPDRITVTVRGKGPDVVLIPGLASLPFFSALFGANDAAAAAPQAAAMRDGILTESQDAYAQGEKEFLRSLVKSPEGLKTVIKWAIASDKSVVARATYEDLTTDLRQKLREIKTPVMMLYPWDASSGVSQAATDGLYQQSFAALANKTMARIDNSFHFIMLDQPDLFAAQLDEFLK